MSAYLQKAHGPQEVGDPHPQAAASGRMSSSPDPQGLGHFPLWRDPPGDGSTSVLNRGSGPLLGHKEWLPQLRGSPSCCKMDPVLRAVPGLVCPLSLAHRACTQRQAGFGAAPLGCGST